MAWIRVTETFRHRPNQGTCVVYRPGTYNVPTAAATLAVAAGKAVRMTKARKDEEPVEVPRWLTGDEAIAASREWLSLKAIEGLPHDG
jgi:hypothetical protein